MPAARSKRKANDPPKAGRPASKLKTPKQTKAATEGPVYCPCCERFVHRQTAWRHSKGQNVPMRTRAAHTTRYIIDASRQTLQNLLAKVASPSSSPVSHASSRFESGSQSTGGSSLKSKIIRGFSRLLSPQGSPIVCDDTGDGFRPEETPLQAAVDADSNTSDSPPGAGDDDLVSPASPTIEEWSHQRRTTVEEVEDEDQASEAGSDGGSDNGDWGFEGWNMDADEAWTPEDFMREQFERAVDDLEGFLSDDDIALLRAFALKVEDNLSDTTFDKFRFSFPENDLGTYKAAKARIQFLAGFKPVTYDCCPNSCMAYTGPDYSALESCPFCGTSRYNSQKQANKHYTYIPLIPRLRAYFRNPKLKEEMQYRHQFETTDRSATEGDPIEDVFDSANYKLLKGMFVNVEGKQYSHTFFNDPRDIALGLSTDGFCPFKRRKQTCWPIILFNYNLPPDVRFAVRRILCVGVIPGPKKPKDSDSFLYPLVQELLQLSVGVTTFDSEASALFKLRAYPILGFGDYPAISMIMQMKGHNGIFPCRMCLIEGLRVPNHRGTTHYVPLHRCQHPNVIEGTTRRGVTQYDPANLPIRSHTQFMKHARLVQFASNNQEAEELGKACGIKGIPLLSCIPSLFFPTSFPFDFMHLAYENLIKNLVHLWTGNFKDIDHSGEDYVLSGSVWEAIGEATARSGSTIPGAYGARPQNVADDTTACTADSWSFWALYLGPILLQRRFSNADYYKHFIKLVQLLNLCLQFSITRHEIQTLRVGFQDWVVEYESNDELDFTIVTTLSASPYALSQSMHCSTLPMELKHVDQFGHTGHFQWNAIVAF
ncbi:hypothetical protein MD484_g1964, partial [Candolleomyces efflorescens]